MKKMSIILGLILLVACKKEAEKQQVNNYDQIKKAEWLIGNWENRSSDGHFTEKWKFENDSTYIGNSYFVIESDTVFAEQANLVQRGNDLLYVVNILTEKTDKQTEFRLTSASENQFVFENPENDFPKKITYNRINKDSIFAEISGGGNPQGFPMKREK